ncbi:oligosaccharide flippase family protein [Paucibacter sp. APW11]|uniref:Oligosaccharide flippase family protein n=1 Tax=Roseateles aquae TaxID=3077235 RepID=A0ABU3PFA9_9BURK|nr:oligosaccharide flippase family protein [Paucibacter sp. APW11]MDT9001264.1 oligosaccharide flippase family protein [Paucibacter sp. APW11]
MSSVAAMLLGRFSPRTQRLLGTAVASYAARLASALSLLITIPLARHSLSVEMFGVWMMLSSLLGFFSFADLGVGNGVISRLTAAHARGDRSEALAIMLAGYSCTAAAGLLLLLATGLWVLLSANPLSFAGDVPAERRIEVASAFGSFVLLLAINVPASLAQRFQLATQQGHWVGLTQGIAALSNLVAVPLALWFELSLPSLVFASLGCTVLVNLLSSLTWLSSRGYLLEMRASQGPSLVAIRAILRTGAAFFVLQLCAAFAFQSDALVIAQVLGQQSYGDFAAIQRVFLAVSTLAGAALMGLWPAFGDALNSGDIPWARRMLVKALATGAAVMGGICLALIACMDWLTAVWLHMSTPPPLLLTSMFGIWTVIDALGNITGSFLNGSGLLRGQLLVAVAMACTAFAGKWWAVAALGSWGAVLATIVAYLLISVPAQIVMIRHVLTNKRQTLRTT